MASSSFTSSSNSSLVSIVKALSCLLFLSFSSVFLGVTADTLSKNVSSSAARKRDASSSSSSSAAARKREEDARVVDQLAANLMMNAGARMQNEKTPRNNGTFALLRRETRILAIPWTLIIMLLLPFELVLTLTRHFFIELAVKW